MNAFMSIVNYISRCCSFIKKKKVQRVFKKLYIVSYSYNPYLNTIEKIIVYKEVGRTKNFCVFNFKIL